VDFGDVRHIGEMAGSFVNKDANQLLGKGILGTGNGDSSEQRGATVDGDGFGLAGGRRIHGMATGRRLRNGSLV